MGGHRHMREVHDSLCLRDFPNYNPILIQYMISTCWLHLMDGLGHYIIRPGAVAHILNVTNNIMALGYAYVKHRIKKPPGIF